MIRMTACCGFGHRDVFDGKDLPPALYRNVFAAASWARSADGIPRGGLDDHGRSHGGLQQGRYQRDIQGRHRNQGGAERCLTGREGFCATDSMFYHHSVHSSDRLKENDASAFFCKWKVLPCFICPWKPERLCRISSSSMFPSLYSCINDLNFLLYLSFDDVFNRLITLPELLNEKRNPRYSTPFLMGNIWVFWLYVFYHIEREVLHTCDEGKPKMLGGFLRDCHHISA